VAGLLVSWELVARAYPELIPTPLETLRAMGAIGAQRILHAVLVTLENSITGYLVGLALALVSVSAAYTNRHAAAFFDALNTLIQSVSILVWAIVFIMIFGVVSRKAPILVVAAATYPILLSGLFGALRALDKRFALLARLLGASRYEELIHFILPGMIPYLVAASRSAIGIALRISVVAEAFGASGGVGYWLVYSYDVGFREGVFAWALILVLLMIIVDYALLRPVERWSMKWRV